MSAQESPRWYLRDAHIGNYGRLAGDSLGSFGPAMNVVFGKNESGKSTWASFVAGVLFGWPDGRSRQNTYKPANAERSGQLVFAAADGQSAVLARSRNADGVQDEQGLLADIDEPTFQTVFALDSDELLGLDNPSELTSHLLTAGAGTAISPAQALAQIEGRLSSKLSRAAAEKDSIPNLTARLEQVNAELAQAEAETRSLMAENREFEQLGPRREELSERHESLNALIEGRTADLSLLHKLEEQAQSLNEQRLELQAALDELELEEEAQRAVESAADSGFDALLSLDPAEEREIRDTLDDLQSVRDRLEAEADYAKRNYSHSKAAYELLVERSQRDGSAEKRKRQLSQLALSIVLPLVSLLIGVPTTLYGWSLGSLSITAFGVVLVGAALMMGIAALIMMRPAEPASNMEERIADAEWAMRQDQKALQACERELAEHDEQVESYLRFNKLGAAGSSLRRARSLLDQAREGRAGQAVFFQRKQDIQQQLRVLERNAEQVAEHREGLLEDAQVASLADFEQLLARAIDERKLVIEQSEEADTRYGELANRLAQAKDAHEFQALKQERSALRTRLAESKLDFARLLIARRNLAQAIQRWEAQSQPEVYRAASELFAEMTQGAWQQVRLGADGAVQVVSERGETCAPELLSLGTRQQLYLCLRIALLMTASKVGRAMPVLADDILVNFDAERRRLAAQALVRLSRQRQLILFTCHEEVRDLVCALDPAACAIELS